MHLTSANKTTLGFSVALLLMLGIGAIAWHHERQQAIANAEADRVEEILLQLESLLSAVTDGETGERGFIIAGDERYLEPYRDYLDRAPRAYQGLLGLTANDARQQAKLAHLKTLLDQRASLLSSAIERRRAQGGAAVEDLTWFSEGKAAHDRIRLAIADMKQSERETLAQQKTLAVQSSRNTQHLIAFFSLMAAVVVLVAMMVNRRDDARRRAAETSLCEQEEKISVTLKSIGDGVLSVDTRGRITGMNPAAEWLTGWPQAEALGGDVNDVFRMIDSETRSPTPLRLEEMLRGEVSHLSERAMLMTRHGSERNIADTAAPIRDEAGRLLGIVLVFRDVTRERQAEASICQLNAVLQCRVEERTAALDALHAQEEEIRAILNNLLDCVITTDVKGVIKSANPALTAHLGYAPDDVIGQNVAMLMPEPVRANHGGCMQRYLSSGVKRMIGTGREVEGLHRDGRSIPMRLSLSEYTVQGERRFVGSLRDIRESKRFVDELIQARMDAEQANHAKSLFLATMSHEIRTPMNGVIGLVDVLAQGRLTEHQAGLVRTIGESANTLLRLIGDILDFSKIEEGRLEIDRGPMSLTHLLESLCQSLLIVATRGNVALHLFISPRIPEALIADELRLRQVLFNLMGNAIKFSSSQPKQPGRVSIRAEVAQAEPLQIAFRVIDNGIGMNREILGNLFKPFCQGEVSTTRRFGGTGLGLAICKRLVDLMDGEIAVESAPEAGTTFTVTLPVAPASEQPAGRTIDLSGIDCVLVTSARLDMDDVADYLEDAGARVCQVSHVKGAIQAAKRLAGRVVTVVETDVNRGQAHPAATVLQTGNAILTITKGRRRSARVEVSGAISLDSSLLCRSALLRAVAMAAGRVSPTLVERADFVQQDADEETAPLRITKVGAQARLILVAEDDDTNQKVIQQQLELLGHAAHIADDGEQALELWRKRKGAYVLLLTDLQMPRMDGYMLAEAIRRDEAEHSHLPILAISANAGSEEAGRALAAGMDDYLIKPLRLHQLRAALEKWLPKGHDAIPAAALAEADLGPRRSPAVDVSVLEGLVGDDPETQRGLLSHFRSASERVAEELRSACAAGDLGQMSASAHKLKSACRSVGALALGDLCASLEATGKSGDGAAVMRDMAAFESNLDTVQAEIGQLLSIAAPHSSGDTT